MGLSTSLPNAVVQPGVCTSATRPSSPYKGQTIYETDTGRLLVYYGVTTGWQLPWGQAWGVISYVQRTTAQTGITTRVDVTSMTTGSITYVANRLLRITVQTPKMSGSVADTRLEVFLMNGATTLSSCTSTTVVAGVGNSTNLSFYDTTTATARTYDLEVVLSGAGTGSISASATNPFQLIVEDIGPSTSTAPTA